jgi:N-acetylmuramoyl-L-alanine amidase
MATEPEAPGSSVMKVKNPGGAQGVVTGVPEYQLDLAVSLKLRDMLAARGYKVVMTRTTNDVDLGSNIARAQVANNCSADLFVRVHADGVDDSSVKGISIQIPGAGYIKDSALLAASRKASACVLSGMTAATGARSRGLAERDDMTGFNWCTRPMMLVEMGFMSNPDEDRLMETDAYQMLLASGMANGIDAYFAS